MDLSVVLMFTGLAVLGGSSIYVLFSGATKFTKFLVSLFFVIGLSITMFLYNYLVEYIQYFVASWSALGVIFSIYKYVKSLQPEKTEKPLEFSE